MAIGRVASKTTGVELSMSCLLLANAVDAADDHRLHDAVRSVVLRQAIYGHGNKCVCLSQFHHREGNLLPSELQGVVGVVLKRQHGGSGGLVLELRILGGTLNESRHEFQMALAIAELQAPAHRARRSVARG